MKQLKPTISERIFMKMQLPVRALALILLGFVSACSSRQDPADSKIAARVQEQVPDQSKLSVQAQEDFIARQKEEMQRQERELQDLRRQKFHDDYFRSQYERRAE